jgi:hypothetical protein
MARLIMICKCAAILVIGMVLGIALPLLSMRGVFIIAHWDDAPGGGIAALMALMVGFVGGTTAGLILVIELWANGAEKNRTRVTSLGKVSLSLLLAVTLFPSPHFCRHCGRRPRTNLCCFPIAWLAGRLSRSSFSAASSSEP